MSLNLVVSAAFLAVVYVAAVGSMAWGDAVAGVVLGGAIARWGRGRSREHRWTRARLAGVPRLGAGILLEIVRGSATMTRVLAGRPRARRGGLITASVGARTTGGMTFTAFVVTAAPGSIVLDVDARRRQLRVHAIDARDPAAIRAAIKRFYERHQRQAVP
jgi:multisubunit Na+/H+ antiporter MnhE subunit